MSNSELTSDSYVIKRCPKTGVALSIIDRVTGDLIHATNRTLNTVNSDAFDGLLVPVLNRWIAKHVGGVVADIAGGEHSRCAIEIANRYPQIGTVINVDWTARPVLNNPGIKVIAGDLTNLDRLLPQSSIDLAYSSYLLPMLPRYKEDYDQIAILSALTACMNRGGLALIHESPSYFQRRYSQELIRSGALEGIFASGVGDSFLVLAKEEDPAQNPAFFSIKLDPIVTL